LKDVVERDSESCNADFSMKCHTGSRLRREEPVSQCNEMRACLWKTLLRTIGIPVRIWINSIIEKNHPTGQLRCKVCL